jgi:hypothetical protein
MDFLDMLRRAGFENAELVAKTGFNSSPKTEGVLLRGAKPEPSINIQRPKEETIPFEEKVHVMEKKPSPSIEAVIDRAYALGCEKAKVIDTSTIIVEEWVRWKCLYGCPFFNKDAYHPPFAPGVDETRKVLGQYTKAILLNGPKGKAVTDISVRLEGEAYQMGFYKAFALTALPSGGGGGEPAPGAT